ncbi:MAG: bifunctional metallophosphatase/5'-nucleotidase [Myxococcaceae bacterium]
MARRPPVLFAAAVFLFSAGCRSAGSPRGLAPSPPAVAGLSTSPPIRITLVGTNDLHGWLFPRSFELTNGATLEEGGLATLGGYLANIRADNPGGVLLLDGGDLFQGTLAANLTEGSAVIDAYNKLGYQAAAVGNHEFDYGPTGPISVARAGDDPFGALKARIVQAKFPLLAVNVYDAASGQRPAWLGNDGTHLFEVKGIKVGVIGLITPQTPQVTSPVNVATLRFGNLVPEAIAAAKRVREKGADVVIAVAHAGGKCGKWDNPNDLSTCDAKHGEIFELLAALPPGTLDAVVAGHTHAAMGHFVNGVPVIETWGYGRALGLIELFVDPQTQRVLPALTKIQPVIPLCAKVDELTQSCDEKTLETQATAVRPVVATFKGRPVVPDKEVAKLLIPARERVAKEQTRKLGVTLKERLGRKSDAESPLGSFLADSLREMERADVSLMNSGGLREDLIPGELTYGQVYEVLPFDNTVASLTLTGEELKRLLFAAYGGRKGVFQLSGMKITLSRCAGQGRLRAYTLADGKPLLPAQKYKVVLPDFLARGGDGLGPSMAAIPPERVDLGVTRDLNLRDSLVAYWQKKKGVLNPPALGRITFLDDADTCSPATRADR